jgi:hypothetical protein
MAAREHKHRKTCFDGGLYSQAGSGNDSTVNRGGRRGTQNLAFI